MLLLLLTMVQAVLVPTSALPHSSRLLLLRLKGIPHWCAGLQVLPGHEVNHRLANLLTLSMLLLPHRCSMAQWGITSALLYSLLLPTHDQWGYYAAGEEQMGRHILTMNPPLLLGRLVACCGVGHWLASAGPCKMS